ncbi:hypothetical protein TNCV_2671571 [Trichonephila clavipes]|nr:hypothetical protein TNCV_2671571 [Trichonephila clavipes]
MCLRSHRQQPVNSCGEGQSSECLYRDFTIPILEASTAIYSSPVDEANLIGQTFANVSSSDLYSPEFQATKNRLERHLSTSGADNLYHITVTLTCGN